MALLPQKFCRLWTPPNLRRLFQNSFSEFTWPHFHHLFFVLIPSLVSLNHPFQAHLIFSNFSLQPVASHFSPTLSAKCYWIPWLPDFFSAVPFAYLESSLLISTRSLLLFKNPLLISTLFYIPHRAVLLSVGCMSESPEGLWKCSVPLLHPRPLGWGPGTWYPGVSNVQTGLRTTAIGLFQRVFTLVKFYPLIPSALLVFTLWKI